MPIGHLGITVRDINKARAFYLAALKPLGYAQHMSFLDGKVLGFGTSSYALDFWISEVNARNPEKNENREDLKDIPAGEFIHLAFAASNREQVRQFYNAAIAAGAKDNGPPGLRPHYFRWYYGAFVLDLEGRNLEAVCVKPGILAEPWGIMGWGAAGVVASAVTGCVATWMGWI